MVVVENTHNYAGGTVIKPEQVSALAKVAHEHDLKVHCDGARLFNAAVALDVPAKSLVKDVDSVMICLSKGLSAPVGSLVAGTEEFIHQAHRIRKKMGGGMRQAGIIAAPGIIALEKMIPRLKDDHANARLLYERLSKIPRVVVETPPETNILFIRVEKMGIDATRFSEELNKRGVLVYGEYGTRIRLVTHRMVGREDVIKAAQAVEDIAKSV
jgi:threonine aldolase